MIFHIASPAMLSTKLPSAALKRRLKSGEAIGCHWLSLGAPALAEMAAAAGPDAIVLDMQHGLWDRAGLEAAIGATAGETIPLVRTADHTAISIGTALDAGAHGIIVPMIQCADECRSAIAAAFYPPRGIRSGGGVRPLIDFDAYRSCANANLAVSVMIETVMAVDAVEAIASVHGLDLLFIGSGDLSISLGEPSGSPAFEDALARILAAGRAAGIPVGIFTPTLADAISRAAQGYRFVVFANDIDLNSRELSTRWKKFRSAVLPQR